MLLYKYLGSKNGEAARGLVIIVLRRLNSLKGTSNKEYGVDLQIIGIIGLDYYTTKGKRVFYQG